MTKASYYNEKTELNLAIVNQIDNLALEVGLTEVGGLAVGPLPGGTVHPATMEGERAAPQRHHCTTAHMEGLDRGSPLGLPNDSGRRTLGEGLSWRSTARVGADRETPCARGHPAAGCYMAYEVVVWLSASAWALSLAHSLMVLPGTASGQVSGRCL